MAAQGRSASVAPSQAPVQAPAPTQGAPAPASNAAAQEGLATRQARTFEPIAPGSVTECAVDVDLLSAHLGALWGELEARSATRSGSGAETPVTAFDRSPVGPQVRRLAADGSLARARFESDWVSCGGFGMSGSDLGVATPLAKAKIEITPLVGDLEVTSTGAGTASAGVAGQAGSGWGESAEVSASQSGVGGKIGASSQGSTGSSTSSGLSMSVPMQACKGVLALDCRVSFRRTFGPDEQRAGRIVAGWVRLNRQA